MINEISLPAPDDWHAHLRDEPILSLVAPVSALQFRRIVAMGNVPAIRTVADWVSYDAKTNAVTRPLGCTTFVSPKITRSTTGQLVSEFYKAGVRHLKFYPEGATTGSDDGMANFFWLFPICEIMQVLDMVLQIHAEIPATWQWVDCRKREAMCLPLVYLLVQNFPKLRIVVEHISCAESVAFIEAMPETVAATVTLQHLEDTANDVRGGLLDPHRVCKPEPKEWADREAIRTAVFYKKLRRVFFGSDSAPHDESKKHSAQIPSGDFTAVGLVPRLIQLFLKHAGITTLGNFVSVFGADFYGYPRNRDYLFLSHNSSVVDEKLGNIRNYLAGQTLEWKVEGFV